MASLNNQLQINGGQLKAKLMYRNLKELKKYIKVVGLRPLGG
jgi:hypothetical protein